LERLLIPTINYQKLKPIIYDEKKYYSIGEGMDYRGFFYKYREKEVK